MERFNEHYFGLKEQKNKAQGFAASGPDGGLVSSSGDLLFAFSNGGIRSPRDVTLPVGKQIVRIGNGPMADYVAGGAWWMDVPNFNKIVSFAKAANRPVSSAIRDMCAVPVPFNTMTMIVVGKVTRPLAAYQGKGNAATAEKTAEHRDPITGERTRIKLGVNETVIPSGDIEQLYIPGLNLPDLRRRAVFIIGYDFLDTDASEQGFNPILSIAT